MIDSRRADTGGDDTAGRSSRGQLVLLGAGLLALALLPVALAFVQLGSHPDVAARTAPEHDTRGVLRGLDRAVDTAARQVSGEYAWSSRSAALAAFERNLSRAVERVESSAVEQSVVVRVSRNHAAASAWAAENCPSGPRRQFGACRVTDGVVVQSRAEETHVVAVAVSVRLLDRRGATRVVAVLTVP